MKQDSVWGTDTELLAFTLRFHTRVVSFVNYPPGIAAIDTLEILRRDGWIEAFSDNKPLKDKVKALYLEYKTSLAKAFIPGSKIRVSREKLVEFIENAIQKINNDQRQTHAIYRTFKMCGLNPYDEDLTNFKKHLDSLNKNKVYATLECNNKALDL